MSNTEFPRIEFRAWTGKRMMYQEDAYLQSFIRRLIPQIIWDHDEKADYRQHESYLPNGGNIDEYLQQYTGLTDKNGKKIFRKDIVRVNGGQGCLEFISHIIFDQGAFRVAATYDQGFPHTEDIEIIGNRKEHPELLASTKGEEAQQ